MKKLIKNLKHRGTQSIVAFNQFINAFFLGGWADETMSSRAYRMEKEGKPWGILRQVIDFVCFWEKEHCKTAFLYEQERRHSHPSHRENKVSK